MPLSSSILSQQDLASYDRIGEPQPDVAHPRFVWASPWTHSWNSGMVYMLSEKFLSDVRSGTRGLSYRKLTTAQVQALQKHVTSLTNVQVQKLIQNKLKRSKVKFRKAASGRADTGVDDQAKHAKADRQASRRRLVSW